MISSVVFIALFSRYVGVEQFGQYSYALSIAALLSGLVAFGLDAWAIREVAQSPTLSATIIGRSLFIQVTLALLSLLGLAVYWNWVSPDPNLLWIVLIVAGYVFLDTMSLLLISVFRAREKMEYETAAVTAGNLAMVALTAVGILLRVSVNGLLVLIATSYALKFVVIVYYARQKCGLVGVLLQTRPAWGQIKTGLPFFLSSIGNTIYMSYPRLVLGALGSFQSVGLYAAAEKVVLLISVFAGVLDVVLYPIFVKQMQRSVREFARAYERTADLVLVVGLLLAIGLSGLMPEIIWMLFGSSYKNALPITLLLVPSISMSISGYVNGRAMFVLRKERLMSVLIIGTALAGFLLASVSVNMLGAMGVALSVLLSAAFGFAFYFVYVRTQLGLPWLTGRYILYFALFPIVFLVSYAWRDAGLAVRLMAHLALMAGLIIAFTWTHLIEWQWVRDLIRAFLRVLFFSRLREVEQGAFFVNTEVEHTDEK